MYNCVFFEDTGTYMTDVILTCAQISNDVFCFKETKNQGEATKMSEEQAADIAEQMRNRGRKAVNCLFFY